MEICPENSRFGMRWNFEKKEFCVCAKGKSIPLLTLPYAEGRYIYACLRGQQRIEELGKLPEGAQSFRVLSKSSWARDMSGMGIALPEDDLQKMWRQLCAMPGVQIVRGGRNPAVTHRFLYTGHEAFAHTEDARKRTGMDVTPRVRNREEDCHVAARTFLRMLGLQPDVAYTILKELGSYEELIARMHGKMPLLVELATHDSVANEFMGESADAILRAHSCIMLGRSGDECIVFEKVGINLPWRLTTLREVYGMYEDFKRANADRPKLLWTVSEVG
jgi:hypothetical protein